MSIENAYNEWSSQYDTNKNRTRDLDKQVSWEMLRDLDFESVLELGCGTGKNTEWLRDKASNILAVDFSEEMLSIAKKKITNENIRFHKADITKKWEWTSEKFDLVTCNLILEHIEDLQVVFDQAFSKLKPGGHFFISELHPFKQYSGTKARFHSEDRLIELETFTHHVSEYLNSATKAGFQLSKLQEHFDEDGNKIPRLLSLLFKKS
ncbi:class I SAM-dependent methyltransferase [Gramella sp. BOM4]|nr:class I SAM-dependent methyltransferase [Christiangramia bathymodioli]